MRKSQPLGQRTRLMLDVERPASFVDGRLDMSR